MNNYHIHSPVRDMYNGWEITVEHGDKKIVFMNNKTIEEAQEKADSYVESLGNNS